MVCTLKPDKIIKSFAKWMLTYILYVVSILPF